ncbi:MAG TPA: PD-(D/E)XK nuclease family protein [Longimicrobiales bacterium]|nr:PD-(D/E)XK nuclease family protein [Longimicrobiales bacterium]
MTQRLLLPWSRPLLPQAARLLVEHYTSEPHPASPGAEARMDGAVVVLPGSRAGRRLKELLVGVADGMGVRLVPPRIVTLGVLPELLYDLDGPVASTTVRRLVWAEALREVAGSAASREHLSRIFAALPGGPGAGSRGDTLGDWTPLARELSQLARTVAAGGYRFRDVAARCGGSLLYDDAPRWRTLARVQDRVEARLGELGFMDRDLARLHALDQAGLRLPGDVWLVGVAEMTGVLRRMLGEARGGSLRTVIHAPGGSPPEDGVALFDELGCIRVEAWSAYESPVPDHGIRMVDRPAHQAEAVAEILTELNGRYAPDEVAIGVPSPEVVPALEQRLPKSGVAVRDAAGTLLSASGPFRLLRGVAEFLAERRWEAFAALVRHPDLAPALEAEVGGEALPGDWLTQLDAWYGRHLPSSVPGLFRDPRSKEGAATRMVVERLDRILAELASPAGAPDGGASIPLSRWVEPVLRVLAGVYGPHALSQENEADRLVLRALSELRWAAESLARIPAPLDTPCEAHTALRILLEEAGPVRLPAPAREGAVEMLGWLELHLDDTPVTIVTGVNEGALPESVRGDPFLPDALRRLLGLEDNRQRHARDVYRLAAMAHSREVLHLVSGRRTADGDPLRPSRLLFAADDETVARRVRTFYGEGSGQAGDAPGEAAAVPEGADPHREASSRRFRLPPEAEIPLDPFPQTIAVTDFRRLIEDPYEWALARVRRLDILEDRALEMDGALFGTLAHDVLQDFGSEEVRRHARGELVADPDRLWRELEDHLERHVGGRFGPGASRARVAVRLQVEQLRSRLRAFARWHAERLSQGWRVRAVELGLPRGEGIPFTFDEALPPVGLRARIDRVDHNPQTGEWAVFDYKTSDAGDDPEKVHRKGRSEKVWLDLQLPLYHWLATRIPGPDGAPVIPPDPDPVIGLGYILLPRDLEKVGHAMAGWDAEEVADGVERARELLRELARGPVRFDAGRRPKYAEEQMEALVGRSVLVAGDEAEEDA